MDSCKQAFLLLDEKRQKFCNLVNLLLASDFTDVNTLQRLSGKYTSFSLAVPGARLFINEINLAFGRGFQIFGIMERLPALARRVTSPGHPLFRCLLLCLGWCL